MSIRPLELESSTSQKEAELSGFETTLGIIVGGVCFDDDYSTTKSGKKKNHLTRYLFQQLLLNNPNYKQEHTEDDGYIDTNTYSEPIYDLYEICDTPNYGIIDEATTARNHA